MEDNMMMQKKILVVSSDPTLLGVLEKNLTGSSYSIECTDDIGEELNEILQETTPDLVILDIIMPKLEGIELCLRIRQWCSVPIIMLSTWGTSKNSVRGLDLSSDSYLTEPFSLPELMTRIEKIVSPN